MRCIACNVMLSDYESTRKYEGTDEYIDLCNRCFGATGGINVDSRQDLSHVADDVEFTNVDEEWDELIAEIDQW